jgi:hypothetical protein
VARRDELEQVWTPLSTSKSSSSRRRTR